VVIAERAPVAETTAAVCCVPLSDPVLLLEEAARTAELFKALGDPARVRIVNLLAQSSEHQVCICDLVEPLGLSQPTVSHHMKKLFDVGLVDREQRGKWAFFTLNRAAIERLSLVADLRGVCC
jgi:ArsR family transcriptional regulator